MAVSERRTSRGCGSDRHDLLGTTELGHDLPALQAGLHARRLMEAPLSRLPPGSHAAAPAGALHASLPATRHQEEPRHA